ncbi:c7a3b714-df4d-4a8e-8b62-d7e90517f534 [Thermothielavioides terrestris]|uniref:Sec20 C-terminal domain-containing protein n=2 Tax=Thermothielavioides terrestris TaxID=2587410 RepID=G2RFE3_THETT|nr:uncharacterized protein THITE_2121860 [Thermothielavioides terrestris NRRL 8126]AEO70426.1 hypothetical protein THITE_2121860 [Thermothielavioides terrestris NRRL 8126]SPQ18249.1 c7a3b714-df4d-4a8e-8b62-d7e90517f534 [Thermothielavioides terrestris]
MAAFESLQERLAALQETTGQLRELIDRLATITFQPGSVPMSASDEDNVAAELGAEISQILREEEEDLELLQEEIIDLRAGRPGSEAEQRKTRLKEGVHRLQAELKDCRTAFRKAQLSARRSLDAAQKLERELLLASYAAAATSPSSSTVLTTNPDDNNNNPNNPNTDSDTTNPAPAPSSTDDPRAQLFTARDRRRWQHKRPHAASSDPADAALATSSDITLALRRTHALIAGELSKSAFAAQTLAESSAALAELQRSYEGVAGLLTRSRELVGELVRANKSDTWYLQAAVRLLLATLAWLVFRRLLYGPLWWLVWLPVRTGWRVGKGVVVGGGSQQGGGRMEVVGPGEEEGDWGGRRRTVVVGVGEEGAVPTVRVAGRAGTEEKEKGVPDSMVEQVGRMVEDTLNRRDEEEEANRTEGDELEDRPNPMKRMWEEEGVQEAEGIRDEL